MVDLVQAGAIALHTLAMILVLGYYLVLGRLVIPVVRRAPDAGAGGELVAAMEARALPLIAVAVVVFIGTGAYLMLTDPQFTGVGQAMGTWGALILAKHAIVIAIVALGVLVDVLVRDVLRTDEPTVAWSRLGRVGLAADAITVLGIVVVVMTAAAQLSA